MKNLSDCLVTILFKPINPKDLKEEHSFVKFYQVPLLVDGVSNSDFAFTLLLF